MMQSPALGRPITSPFGPRLHPITGQYVLHRGIDYGGSFAVRSAAAGFIEDTGYSGSGFGHWVRIRHSDTLRTLYAHGAHATPWQKGDRIGLGALVFQSGKTGATTGEHLHFEVHEKRAGVWIAVDPEKYLNPPPTITIGATMNHWTIVLHKSGRNQAYYLVGDGIIRPVSLATVRTATRELGLKKRTVSDAGMAAIRAHLEAATK